jgi:hypothetical protein
LGLAVLGVTAGLSMLATNEAGAKGCNGVVDQLKWGCAAWDNNNGPQYPHYKKKSTSAAKPAAAAQPVVAPPKHVVAPNAPSGIVSGGAGNIVSGGAGNIVSGGAGNAVRK